MHGKRLPSLPVVDVLVLKLDSKLFSLKLLLRMYPALGAAPLCLLLFLSVQSWITPVAVAYSVVYHAQTRVHPTSENIPKITDPDFLLKPPGDISTIGVNFYSSLALTDSFQIGVDEGEIHEMLGNIVDIALDPDGRIFVLDSEFSEVLIYNADGSYFGTFGSAGAGPGEFHTPRVVSLSDSGTIAVVFADRIQVYERLDNGHFHSRNSFGAVGSYGCAMNGHIYILRLYPNRPDRPGNIQKFTLDGEWVASFGHPYKSDKAYVATSLSRKGKLACSERHGVVGMVLDRIPVLYGYTEEGSLLWRVKFEGLRAAPVEERDGGRTLGFKRWSAGEAALASLHVDADGHFNIRYMVFVKRGREAPHHLYRINAQTGYGKYAGHAPMLRAIYRDYVVQTLSHPYPALRVFHYGQ